MPTSIQKQGKGFVVVEKSTGKVKSHHKTKALAKSSQRAREAGRHGFKFTRRRRK